MTLTDRQRECVEARGQDVCVVAGPGSGKTRVLIARFRWLVEEEKLDPRRILAITFTDKAATEIRQRLVAEFADQTRHRAAIERAWISTIHGFCARLLKDHAIAAGVDPEFVVLDENQAAAELEAAAVETLDQLLREDRERLLSLLDRLYVSSDPNGRQPDLAQALIAVYDAMRVAGASPERLVWTPAPATSALEAVLDKVREYLAGAAGGSEAQVRRVEDLRAWLSRAAALGSGEIGVEHFRLLAGFPCSLRGLKAGNAFYDAMKPLRDETIPALKASLIAAYNQPLYELLAGAIRRIDAAWRRRKRELSALDFDDLEEGAIRLLREEAEVAARVRDSFDAVLMDELQDTNPLQWRLVNLLRRPGRFFAVGDVNQSIFGFRHAEPEVFRSYRDAVASAGKPVHELRRNHRSRREVLDAVNAVFAQAPGVEPHRLEPCDKFAPKSGPSVEVIVAQASSSGEAAVIEAAAIARRILDLKDALPAQFSDFAVLGRSLNALEPIRQALVAARIPALVAGGRTFFETREVRDLTAWLTVLANPRDEIALAGLLRSPLAGIDDETMLRLCADGRLADALPRFEALNARLQRLRPLRDAVSPDRLASEALDESDYVSALTPHGRANVEKFLGMLRDLHTARPRTLRQTLDELERLRAAAAEPEAPPGESSNAVRLMSIHKSKGLEFPVVFVPALQRRPDQSRPVVCFDPAAGLGVRWRDPAGGGDIADAAFERFAEQRKRKEREEENRLLYVAMTRAEEHLVLSYCEYKGSGSDWVRLVSAGLGTDPVRVVTEAPAGIFEPPSDSVAAVEEILPRPEASGQYDSVVPVTSVSGFRACPRRYYLGRYTGWSGPRGAAPEDGERRDEDGIDASELGTQTHALLAGEAVEDAHPEARELAAAFHRSELGQRAARAARSGRECAFLFALDDVVLRGQIDLWFEEGGEIVLVDYKTDRVTGADHARLEPYRLQLRLYAMALQRMLGRLPDRAFLHLLRSGESLPVDLSPALLEDARAAVAELRLAQDRLDFPLREGRHCVTCEFYRGLCPAAALPL
jgi:ATP-dependent helicase/nuclease subunit A